MECFIFKDRVGVVLMRLYQGILVAEEREDFFRGDAVPPFPDYFAEAGPVHVLCLLKLNRWMGRFVDR